MVPAISGRRVTRVHVGCLLGCTLSEQRSASKEEHFLVLADQFYSLVGFGPDAKAVEAGHVRNT